MAKKFSFLILTVLITTAYSCSSGGNTPKAGGTSVVNNANAGTTQSFYKNFGYKQCEPATVKLQDIVAQVKGAGVQVVSASCGADGRMYAAMCGGPDGRIAIIDAPSSSADKLKSLGFAPLSTLPDAQKTGC